MKNIAIIPARLKSSRFPEKLIQKLNGERIIDIIIKNTLKFNFIQDVIVCSDDADFGKELAQEHPELKGYLAPIDACCGSHRAYHTWNYMPEYDNYITIPADEPGVNPDEINKTFSKINFNEGDIITLYTQFFNNQDLISPLSCKIVTDNKNNMLYNSRNVVPINKNGTFLELYKYKKHLGIFVFPKTTLERYNERLWLDSDDIESLEQNRFVQHNIKIKMFETKHIGFGIDVEEQIKLLEERLKCNV